LAVHLPAAPPEEAGVVAAVPLVVVEVAVVALGYRLAAVADAEGEAEVNPQLGQGLAQVQRLGHRQDCCQVQAPVLVKRLVRCRSVGPSPIHSHLSCHLRSHLTL